MSEIQSLRKQMTECVEHCIIHALELRGFERIFFPSGLDKRIYQSTPFGRLERENKERNTFEVIYLEFSDYSRLRFIAKLAEIHFVDNGSKHSGQIPAERLWAECAGIFYVYCRSPQNFGSFFKSYEFGPRRSIFRNITGQDIQKSVNEATLHLDEIDRFFQKGEIGPHLLRFEIPLPATTNTAI
jgi:hypothetical protein